MKLKIIYKLSILATLPIVTLLIFSLNYINDKYSTLNDNKHKLIHLDVMNKTSNLIHELQIERGLSTSYLYEINNDYFTTLIKAQKEKTDIHKNIFLSSLKKLDKGTLSITILEYINIILPVLDNIIDIRDKVINRKIKADKSFSYYTLLNNKLISILHNFKIHSNTQETNLDIVTLNSIIEYQEYAGQERAFIAQLIHSENITNPNMRHFYRLVTSQKDEDSKINFLLKNDSLSAELEKIHKKYKNSYFQTARDEIKNHELKKNIINEIYKTIGFGGMIHDLIKYNKDKNINHFNNYLKKKLKFNALVVEYLSLSNKKDDEYKITKKLQYFFDDIIQENSKNIQEMQVLSLYKKLDNQHIILNSKEWFEISTNRIDDLHKIEDMIFAKIFKSIQTNIALTTSSLQKHILLSILTILLLIFGTFYIANSITYSVKKLEDGLNNLFDFLNFKSDKPEIIDTHSNDEINDMAQNINSYINILEKNLEGDQYFINEATQIVRLMQDGDFSQRPYFEPNNPNLVELKSVLNELIELIAAKIKEQTNSLEELNRSLEYRVHQQTLELENQIKEITVSRDKAIQAEIAKDEFLANMSHEIRTPLNAILGFVTILKKQITEEKPLKYLNIIDSSGKSLLTIINDILDFSKIQSGKFIISPYEVNPVEEFSNAALLFASKAYEKHIDYTVYIDPNLPQTINIDATRTKQIFSNLLSNAIKFTNDDGVISVKVICEDKELIISIHDNGIGIAQKNINKIFNSFEQADGSTTRKYGGTGLGLSISHKLAKLMNGDLSVSSKEGEGSTFTLKLPIEIINTEPKLLLDSKKLKKYKIALLGLKESPVKLSLIKKYLQDFGIVDIIELDEYQKNGYDLLFFIPNDDYNEEIVYSKKSSIALLRSATIKLANLDHIEALYAPYTPNNIVQAINDSGIDKIIEYKKVEIQEEELQFIGSILVAEDNKTNQMLISLILDDYGLEYTIANNGLEAVEIFKKEKFDLVLMDENMPELNGIEAMKQIKEYENMNSLVLTPIVALTASVLDSDKEMFMNAGMDGFVGKPIDTNELESELSKFLQKK